MLKRFWDKLVEIQELRAAEYMMRNMSDKQLKDIGITRGEIRNAVRGW